MEETARIWLEKIEAQLRELNHNHIKSSTEMSTKLDISISRQDDQEARIRALEQSQDEQKGERKASERAHKKWLVALLAGEVIFFAISIFVAIFAS